MPASSKVGVVALVSPLVGTSIGDVWFGTGNAAAPLRLFITAKVTATQTAKFVANNTILANGVIKASLQDLPQTPVTTFLLAFPGPTTLLQAPSTCVVHAGAAVFAPWSGTPPVGAFFTQRVTTAAAGAPCPATAAARAASTLRAPRLGRARMTARVTHKVPKRLRKIGGRIMERGLR